MRLAELREYLDGYLRIAEIPDWSGALNGLQVDSPREVGRVACAVDAAQATVEGAVAWGADLLLVHHGLFWDGTPSVTGPRYRRLRSLLANDIALYAAHLPLDLHAEVGNNAVLARRIGLEIQGTFGDHKGTPIGVWGTPPAALDSREALARRVQEVLRLPTAPRVIAGGPVQPLRVGIVTGAAGTMTPQAAASGLDTFITGEGAHHTFFDAMEGGVNLVYAGHYATETVGVVALAEHLSQRFGIPFVFHDHPTGL